MNGDFLAKKRKSRAFVSMRVFWGKIRCALERTTAVQQRTEGAILFGFNTPEILKYWLLFGGDT